MVWPSGSALATNSAAIAPFAPGLFSTTAGWPRSSWNFEPIARPTMSDEPPATNGMITRIGLDGKLCAPAAHATIAPTAAAAQRMNQNIHFLLRRGRQFRLRTMRTLFLVLACATFAAAHAQPYPSKPIRIIVPYAAGGTSDILARQLGPKLSEAWGQPVVVENKPGANGNVGADFVAKSAADGYTLLLTDLGGLVISASVYPQLPFNPATDFTPVIMVSYSPHVLAVHPSVPVKDVRELIAMAKAQPGKLNFAISGIGGAPHLAGIEFAQSTGVLWIYIPAKGGPDAVAAVIAGNANVLFNGMLATYPSVKAGRLKGLAVSSVRRVPSAPELPTVAETLPGFETGSYQGVLEIGRASCRERV